MTRKDYIKAAEEVSTMRHSHTLSERMLVARTFCDFFASDNCKFSRERFLQACKLGENS